MFLIDKIKELFWSRIIDLYLDKLIADYERLEKNIKELQELIDELQKEVDSLHKKTDREI